jgi:hypothetical protein
LAAGAKTDIKNQWGNDAIANAMSSNKNHGNKWRAIGEIKDWQDTHPGQ